MTEAVKKRRKLFQVAKELNLASETIQEFLEKKGVKVKGPNMRIPDDVYDLVLQRFSFEKKEADKIHRRREERIREELDYAEAAELSATGTPDDMPVEVAPQEVFEKEEAEAAPEGPQTPAEESAAEETPEGSAEEPAAEAEIETGTEETPPAEVEEEISAQEAPEETIEEVMEEEKPQVGDIIDHPMARQYLERKHREEELKKQRKKEGAKKKKGTAAKRKESSRPAAARRSEEAEETLAEAGGVPGEETRRDLLERRKDRRKARRDRKEIQEERDARRKKAMEMIRKETRRIRPDLVVADELEVSEETRKEKEGKRKRQKKKKEVDQKEVDTALRKTLAEMSDSGGGKKRRKKLRVQEDEEIDTLPVVKVTEFITTQNLANLLNVSPPEIIRKCLELGLVVTINQRLDMDTIRLLAEEFGYRVEEEQEFGSEYLEEVQDVEDDPRDLKPRSPVVTVMGHVDHGKTSLLDYLRKANVVAGESGGITQHIGAYELEIDDSRKITFLDTPGHEAFTAMRARGAQVTDIVVLVIAGDDRVMPQTEEAIDHARAAGVSIVIAITKIDKPNANPQAIRKQLAERNILVEDWGGTYQCVDVSAKTGENVPELLEKILLEAELLDLKANPNRRARGVVLEALLDKGKGPVATVLIQNGTLSVGDLFVVGQHWGRVRAMITDRGEREEAAGPSRPVQVLGINGIPEAGDRFIVMANEKSAREVSLRRTQLKREQDFRQVRLITLDELSQQIQFGNVKELNLLVKADVDGSAQALADSLSRLSTDTVEVQVIRRAVGPIAESDVILAAASQAIIIGFHVRPTVKAKELAEKENVDIRLYKVIYDAIEDVGKALEGLLEPIEREVVTGTAEIREVFKISRVGSIGGCYVTNGKIARNANVRVIRNDVEIYDGRLASLKRFKEDVREVQTGFECGLMVENFNDIKQGDVIEAYEIVEEAQTLSK